MKQQKTQTPHELTTADGSPSSPTAAETGSSHTSRSYTCSRMAKFVVWLQKQAVESERDITTEQPAVDHIPPASGLTCSKNRENTRKLPFTSTESQGMMGISFSQKRQSLEEEDEDQKQVFMWTSLCLSSFASSSRHTMIIDLVSMCALKSGVQPSQLQTEPSSCRALGGAPCTAPSLRAALGWLCLPLPSSSACHKPSMVPLGSGSSGQACLSHPAMLPPAFPGQGPWLQLCPTAP